MGSPKSGSRLGTRFGPYQLQSVIGVGGMGEVYRAYDTARERMVAIKLLRPEMAADHSFQQRFRRESKVAARLQEPHVIPVHDFGEIDGVLYIDMRLVEGDSLASLLRHVGALAPGRAVSIVRQVAAALDDAVQELRGKLGGEFHVTSTIVPLRGLWRRNLAATNRTIAAEGVRLVVLPDIEDAVSVALLHELVLDAHRPVCVLR